MRTTLFVTGVALLLAAAAACGGSSIAGIGGDGGSGSSSGGSSSGGSGSGSSSGGGGCGAPPPEHCVGGCGGTTGPECIDGTWECPPLSDIACLFDAGSDAGDAGISGDGAIDCVTVVCNAATQYCEISGGGAQLPDAGSNMSYSCPSLPAMPCDAGTGCACIPDRCDCTDDGGYITNQCLYP